MALSGVISTIYTAQEVVDTSLRKLGVLGEGETSDGNKFTDALAELNRMLKSFQMTGPNLWCRAETSVTLVDGTHTYTLSPRPRTVMNMRFAIGGTERRPLSEYPREDWDRFPMKDSTGAPLTYVLDRQRTQTQVRFWPVPDFGSEVWTVPYSYERVIEDLTATTNDLDIPQEAFDLIVYSLVGRLAVDYQMVGQPHVEDCKARASVLLEAFQLFDRASGIEFRISPYASTRARSAY